MGNYVELAVFSWTATMQIFINTAAKDNHVVPPKAKTKGGYLCVCIKGYMLALAF